MYDLEIPFSEIEEINQKLVEEIVLTTGLDKLKASFQTEFHYDEDDKDILTPSRLSLINSQK